MVPTLFYAACVVLAAAGLWWHKPLVAVILPVLYAAALIFAAVGTMRGNDVRVSALVPLTVATMHAGYGFGLAYGIWARFFYSAAWDDHGKMAAISR